MPLAQSSFRDADPSPVVLTLARIPRQSVEQDLCNLVFTVCKGGPVLPALRKSQVSQKTLLASLARSYSYT